MERLNNPLIICGVFYFVLLITIFITNMKNNFTKERQLLFYYIISVILPILIYMVVRIFF